MSIVKEISKDSQMQELLDNFSGDFQVPKVGDSIEGTIFDIGSNAIYVNLGQFGAGVVRGEELQSGMMPSSKPKIGDNVTAIVEELDNEEGFVELSFKQASMERAWNDLQEKMGNKEVISVKILHANKGGLIIELNGIMGFLPVSQLAPAHYPKIEDSDKNKILSRLNDFIGKSLPVRVIDANVSADKLIVSEKAIQDEERQALLAGFNVGDTIEGVVSGVVDFGAFIKFAPKGKKLDEIKEDKKLEGLVHISELAWQLIDNPRDVIQEGDKIKAKVINIENNAKVSLSIKSLKEDPWMRIGEKYKAGDVVKGVVSKINHFGAFVDLDKNIHGLVHISEFSRQKNKIEPKKEYDFKILSIEPESHKLGLKIYTKESSSAKASSDAKISEDKSEDKEATEDKMDIENKKEAKSEIHQPVDKEASSRQETNDKKEVKSEKAKKGPSVASAEAMTGKE